MGFESVAATIIVIGSLLFFASILTTAFNDNWTEANNAFNIRQDIIQKKIDEKMDIENITHDSVKNITSVEVKNSGTENIDLDYLDIYLDDIRIPRSTANRTMDILNSTEIKNPGLWDPEETVEINVTKNLTSDLHYVEVFTKNGNTKIKSFNV